MTMTRWTPLRDLLSVREAMDKLFVETLVPPALLTMEAKIVAIDLYEEADAFTLTAPMPGVDPSTISVQATTTSVTIKGETGETKTEEQKGTFVRRELRSGKLERTIELPAEIDPSKVEATFTHGMLSLKLPKSEVERPRAIPVKTP